jgi:predicted RNase H-like HicB family nuclease
MKALGFTPLEIMPRCSAAGFNAPLEFLTGFTAVIWRKGKSYVSKYPELGLASCGDTFEKAIENLKEAVELYVENAKQLNLLDERR